MVRAPTLAGLLASALVVPALAAAQAPDLRRLLARATELHQAGELERAVKGYEAFLGFEPGIADVRSNLGAAYVQLGRFEEAIREYEKALALGNASDPTTVRFNLALAHHKAADATRARAELTRVVAERPDHANAAMLLANYHIDAGENGKAIELLSRFETSLGEDPGFCYLLGTALLREGEMDRGQVLIDRLLRDGDSAEAHFMMGTAHLEKGDPIAAAEEFQRAVALNPSLPSLNSFLGRTLTQLSRTDEAAESFRRELALNPNDFDANLHLGMYLQQAERDHATALAHYRRALRVRPGSPNARYQIATVYLLTDRDEEALELIEGVVRDVPDFLEGHATLARLYFRRGRREDAERHREIADRLRKQAEAEAQEAVVPQPD
jgi:tetratricopeptide (TPR) repeat protein